MTPDLIDYRFFDLPHRAAPHGGCFFVGLTSTVCCRGVNWRAEISFLDPAHGVQTVANRTGAERHEAMRLALEDFDRGTPA